VNCEFNAIRPLICTADILEKLKLNGTVNEEFIDFEEAYNSGKFVPIVFQFDKLLKFVKLIKTC
jgi:hypothetical protein